MHRAAVSEFEPGVKTRVGGHRARLSVPGWARPRRPRAEVPQVCSPVRKSRQWFETCLLSCGKVGKEQICNFCFGAISVE